MGLKIHCKHCRYYVRRSSNANHGQCVYYPPTRNDGPGSDTRPSTNKDMFCSKWVSREAHWTINFGVNPNG